MKVEKAETKFTPVVITLESQEEVDQMFTLANYNYFKGDLDITEKLFEFLEDKIETEIMPTGRDDVTLVVEF